MDSKSMQSRYQSAAKLMQGIFTRKLVHNDTVFPQWIGNSDYFWYERTFKMCKGGVGKQYRLVNASAGSNEAAFNHAKLADALSKASGSNVNSDSLDINDLSIELSPLVLYFTAFGKRWCFEQNKNVCAEVASIPKDLLLSPDGRQAVFIRDNNIWLRDLDGGKERALTSDGEQKFAYGAVGTAWGCPVGDGVQASWSPDSRKLFTLQKDTRHVETIPYVYHVPRDGSVRPTVIENPVALPGDDNIEEYRLVAIDVSTGKLCEANYRHIPVCRNSWGFFNVGLGWWAKDSRRAYFLDQERGDAVVRIVEFDTDTGSTRILFKEVSDTQINLSLNSEDYPPFKPLPDSNELIWYSERTGWAHLYLYDLETGSLKNAITSGNWLVRDVLHFDADRREIFIQTAGRDPDRDPYYRDICRVCIDTGAFSEIISSDHEYVVHTHKSLIFQIAQDVVGWDIGPKTTGVSPNSNYIVSTRSRADLSPVTILIDRDGRQISEIENANISALPNGWQWPEPVQLLAADGVTNIYALVHRPSHFCSDKKYPVINCIMNGPDIPAVSKGSFINSKSQAGATYLTASALAELGFIVVAIDGSGTSYRNKGFQDKSYGWIPNSGATDEHVMAIRELAKRYPYMDVNNVGLVSIWGMTGGLYGILERPDFYKVSVVSCPQDSRLMGGPVWGEKYEGLIDSDITTSSSPDFLYPEDMAASLEGKLLLMHGMLDTVNPPATTFRLVESLQKANKDFDMLILPNDSHDVSSYLTRRTWDYLVKHMLDCEPPKEFNLQTSQMVVSSLLNL